MLSRHTGIQRLYAVQAAMLFRHTGIQRLYAVQGLNAVQQGRTGHRKLDQPGHNLPQPSPAQWPRKTNLAGLGQDDLVSANELAIVTCQSDIS